METRYVVIRDNETGKYLRAGFRNRTTGKWTLKWVDDGAAEYTTEEAARIMRTALHDHPNPCQMVRA